MAQLLKFEVTVRRFDPAVGPDGPDGKEFVLPVDSPDAEHAISAAMSNVISFTTKVDASGRVEQVAFSAVKINERP